MHLQIICKIDVLGEKPQPKESQTRDSYTNDPMKEREARNSTAGLLRADPGPGAGRLIYLPQAGGARSWLEPAVTSLAQARVTWPAPASPRPAPPPPPAAFGAQGPAVVAARSSRLRRGAGATGERVSGRAGPAAAAGAAGEPAAAAQGAPSDATDAPANLGARSRHGARGPSDEDGRALDAVLLQQLLPVLPCPHRHHPARRLVPGERGDGGAHLRGRRRQRREPPPPTPDPSPRARCALHPYPSKVRPRCWATPALIRLKLYY